ncbi:hypothetical protein Bbelb_378530 [Branchiostoma belcheri]|nr:hypothetical protein Bbelb_378530 [Branchiostoma belcheri]
MAFSGLSRWLATPTGSSCPQCRKKISARTIISKLFFDQPDDEEEEDPSALRNELNAAKAKLSEKGIRNVHRHFYAHIPGTLKICLPRMALLSVPWGSFTIHSGEECTVSV